MSALLFLLLATTAFAAQTTNYELRGVPTPGEVKIDGKVGDWDLTGGILVCYDLEKLLDTHSVRAYMMYDANALYFAFQFKDASPMQNRVDPAIEPMSGWRADCAQFHFFTDRPVQMMAWFFSDKKQPVVQLQYADWADPKSDEGTIPDALAQGAEMAFQTDKDGKGYTQELRLPWKLIKRDGQAYRAGETFRVGLEFMWGDAGAFRWPQHRYADVINPDYMDREFFWKNKEAWGKAVLLAKGNLPKEQQALEATLALVEREHQRKYSTRGSVKFDYRIPADGYVSLVVEKPDGTRVRNLIGDFPRKAGRNADFWDGLNDDGKPASPGEYRVRGLWHPEFDVLYQFSIGNPGSPAWETADGTGGWLSDHAPSSAASDGETIFISGVYYEGGTGTGAFTREGKKVWGSRPPSMLREPATAVDDQYLYLACGRDGANAYEKGLKKQRPDVLLLMRLDKKTGTPVPFEGEQRPFVELGGVPAMTGLPYYNLGEVTEKNAWSADIPIARVKGLAVGGGKAYVSSYFEDEVLVCDVKTGKVLDRIKTPRPAGMTFNAKGELLVVNAQDKRVLKINTQTKEASSLVADHLEAPIGMTLDKAGNLYVSDWGRAMCVKVFSPEGKFQRTVGKEGGRPWVGKFDENGMLLPWGIAIDKDDQLWVNEFDESPRRLSVWKTSGGFVREFVSAHAYAGTDVWINPNEPERAIAKNAEFELDWKKGTYRPIGTIWRPMSKDAHLGPYYDCHTQQEFTIKGRKFLVTHLLRGPFVISERKGDRYQPLAAVGSVQILDGILLRNFFAQGFRFCRLAKIFQDHMFASPAINQYIQEQFPEAYDGTFGTSDYVININADMIIARFPELRKQRTWAASTALCWSDRNGDGLSQENEIKFFEAPGVKPIQLYSSWTAPVKPDLTLYPAATPESLLLWEMPVKGWTECGAPIYEPSSAKLIIAQAERSSSQTTWVDKKGNILDNAEPVMRMYSPDGSKVLWSYPNKWAGVGASHEAPQAEHGLFIGTMLVIGSADINGVGQIFCLNGNQGQAFLMTTDGLMIGALMRDARSAPDSPPAKPDRGDSFKNCTNQGEWFGGQFFHNPRDGKPYLVGFGSSASGNTIFEVTGLDEMKRLPTMTVKLTTAGIAASSTTAGKTDKAEQRLATIKRLPKPATLDGKNDEYPAPVTFAADDSHRASVLAAFDSENLYLFYQVKDNSPLKNQGKQGQFELFKSGDAVLFEIGTKRTANDTNPKAIEGDLRLLLARKPEGAVAVLYRYVAPGSKSWWETTSSIAVLRVDDARVINEAKIITIPKGDGYVIEASIPLSALDWQPKPNTEYRGDFGVIYSDADGLKNTFRLHWATRDTGLISDPPTEGKVQPDAWGILQVRE